MVSAHEAFSRWKAELSEVSESPELELRELVIHFAGIPREKLLAGDAMPEDEALERIGQAVSRRTSGEPLQYLLGEWDFFGRTYAVGPGVLIPRADTETLCEAALREAVRAETLDEELFENSLPGYVRWGGATMIQQSSNLMNLLPMILRQGAVSLYRLAGNEEAAKRVEDELSRQRSGVSQERPVGIVK